ncbi:MAG: TonB-dependent receptor [Emcibacteraceae bacterium]|nr:TonB-dependent receptor [Emcibacteraceae bacterium]
MKKLLLLSVSLPSLVIADLAIAQDGQEEDTITVIGSRVKGRTALDSAVPVDVIQATELSATPSLNMKDAIAAVSPSYVVNRNAIGDGNSLIRTSSLRGLNNGEILTLLNGKRMHRNAIIHTAGWQSADVGSLSVNALKSISILRDGAAAQYGADAVAGVIDLTLDDSEGISAEAQFSQYYEGDGFAYNIASKAGISLADRGFLTVTAQYGATDPTDRATKHLLAEDLVNKYAQQEAGTLTGDALQYKGQFNNPGDLNPDTIAPFGVNEETHFTVTWNSAMEIGENSEVYTFGNFGRKHHKEPFNYRAGLPHGYSLDGVGGNSGAHRLLTYGQNDYTYLYGAQAFTQNAYLLGLEIDPSDPLDADGNATLPYIDNGNGAFSGLGTHPAGYNPWFEMDAQDIGVYAGIRGELDNGLSYDLSGSIGQSRVDNNISSTHNPSLGGAQLADGSIDYANVQTEFYIGSQVNTERTVSADFNYTVDTDAVDNINVAFGAQYRTEQYKNVVGEKNSWFAGPVAGPNLKTFAAANPLLGLEGGRGLNVGSDGFGGFSPDTFFDASRSNYAVYLDVDTDVSEDFNIAVAGRYEDFTDFGDTFSWKIATRYQLIEDVLAIRGAASTGFHAPTVAQINNTQVRTGFRADGSQTQTGTFTADSIPGTVFGIAQIGPELAKNLSMGFIFTPGDNTNITVDLFQVKLRNALAQTPDFDVVDYPNEFAAIAAAGFQGAATLTGVDFPTNQGSRRVRGLEIVATHNVELEDSNLKLTLAYAHVKAKMLEHSLSDRSLFNVENETSPHRATLTANWSKDSINVMARGRYVATRKLNAGLDASGAFIGSSQPLSAYRIDEQPGRIFFDLAITYSVNDQFDVTIGANNLLNTFPLAQPGVVETSQKRGRQFLSDGLDWQGGQYYARISANF